MGYDSVPHRLGQEIGNIINVYAPVSPHLDKEASTKWWAGVIDLVNECTNKGHEVLLMGDFNCYKHQIMDKGSSDIDPAAQSIQEIYERVVAMTGLVDLYRHAHDRGVAISSTKGGGALIDRMMGTKNVAAGLVRIGVDKIGDVMPSDHRIVVCMRTSVADSGRTYEGTYQGAKD